MLYEVAFLTPDNKAGLVRIGAATALPTAERRALRLSNVQRCDTCVVEADTDKIVERIRYYRPNMSVI